VRDSTSSLDLGCSYRCTPDTRLVTQPPVRRPRRLVSGACTSSEKADALRSSGVDAHVWGPDDDQPLGPEGLAALAGAHYVLTSVPPVGDFSRDPVLHTCLLYTSPSPRD
jgi:hypothetical protein